MFPTCWGEGNPGVLLTLLSPSLMLAPPLCPAAREQLRRSRHSRTFLVESGVGELWSEMQAGRRGDGQCPPPPQQTLSSPKRVHRVGETSRSPHWCCLATSITQGEFGDWTSPLQQSPPESPSVALPAPGKGPAVGVTQLRCVTWS